MGELIQLRDYRRKEEQDAELVRIAREVMGLDTAPSEITYHDHYISTDKDPA